MHARLMAACRVLAMWPIAVTAQMGTSGTASRPVVSPPAISPSNTVTRARDLGVPFDGTPGPLNAITDVAGVEVGYKTLISGEGRLVIGKGPVRTGVTAILPRGKQGTKSVFAAYFAGNGNGDMTGTHWICTLAARMGHPAKSATGVGQARG
jgi:Peptidase family S58